MALRLPLQALGGHATIPAAYVVAGIQLGFDNGKLTGKPALSVSLSVFYSEEHRLALAAAIEAVGTAEAAVATAKEARDAAKAVFDARDAAFQQASQGGFTPERAAALADKRAAQAVLDAAVAAYGDAVVALEAARAGVQQKQPIRGLLAEAVQVPDDAVASVLTDGRPDISKVYGWLKTMPTFADA